MTPIMMPLFNVPGQGAFALIMGIISGYPVGAKVATDLYMQNACSKVQAERLIAFTNSSGPLFIISAVGIGMFQNQKIGLSLLTAHFLAAITVGLIFKFYKKSITSNIIPQLSTKSNTINISNLGFHLGEAISNSISTLLMIGGYIVFFAVINEVLTSTLFCKISNPIILGILNGILEITNGLKKLSLVQPCNIKFILPIVSLILGFGGFSVHMQVASIISKSDLSIKPYLIGKSLQGIIAAIYTSLLLKFILI